MLIAKALKVVIRKERNGFPKFCQSYSKQEKKRFRPYKGIMNIILNIILKALLFSKNQKRIRGVRKMNLFTILVEL